MSKKPSKLVDVSRCEGQREVSGLEVRSAELTGILRGDLDPSRRLVVRDSRFERCLAGSRHSIYQIECRDCAVESLGTEGLLRFVGTLFRRVRFRGRIGRVMFARYIVADKGRDEAARVSTAAFYTTVTDWALDFSEADFSECDVRGIPSHLLKLNPEQQIVVTRPMLRRLGADHPLLAPGRPLSGCYIILRNEEECVFSTSPRNRNHAERMEALVELRRVAREGGDG